MNDDDTTHTPMWGFQGWFQSGTTEMAKEVFTRLDEKLDPRVFLVGIPDTEGSETVCLEPAEECGYKPEFFADVMKLAHQIEEREAAQAPGGRPATEGDQVRNISGKSIQKAVQQTLKESDEATSVVSYCSPPTTIGGFKVCCVLQLDAKVCGSHFSLPPVEWPQSTRPAAGSLIAATAVEFLKICTRVLRDPKAGSDYFDTLGREPEEILRMGGRELLLNANPSGAFNALNELSWKTHEGELAGGEIYFFHWDDNHLEMLVEFKNPPELQDIGAARKIIEMAKAKKLMNTDEEKELYLVSIGDSINGIGRLKELENEYDRYSDVFIVRFTGYYRWELRHKDGGVMMQVVNGVPALPGEPIPEEKFKDHVGRIFLKSPPDVDELWRIVQDARAQKKGTMIVISSAAEDEAERLSDQSTLIKPGHLSKEKLLMLTSIDGALLVDPSGLCPAAGVILDGIAVKGKGSRARGARYNSAIKYIYSADKEIECLVVVISEDGMINLMPELNKMIRRSEITEHMDKIRAAVLPEIVNVKEYYKALNWLSAHRFYLSEILCLEITEIKTSTKPRLEKQEGYSMTPANFEANQEMDESYFLDEPGDDNEG